MNADEVNRRETALSFLKRAKELLSEGNVEKATSLVEVLFLVSSSPLLSTHMYLSSQADLLSIDI